MQTPLHRFALTSACLMFATLPFQVAANAQSDNSYGTYRNRALAEQAKGDLKGAIADFTQAIKLKPDQAETYNDRGLAESAKGDWKTSIADFSKAIELKPDYTEAFKNRAAAEYARGDIYNSRKDEAKAAELQKNLSGSSPADASGDLPDISLASCPDSPPSFLSGETYRAYSGCARARGEVAILNLKSGVDGLDKAVSTRLDIHAAYIDGMAAYNVPGQGKEKPEYYLDKSDSLALLPGHHLAKFLVRPVDIHLPVTYFDTNFDVEAGRSYVAMVRTQASGGVVKSAPGPVSQYWIEITEFHDDPAAYLQSYEASIKSGDTTGALSALESYLALFPKDPNHRTFEETARKLRASLNKTQNAAYRASNSGPNGTAAGQGDMGIPSVRGCKPEPQDKTAAPLALKAAANRQVSPDLNSVLERAIHYVEEYEAQLGSLIGDEIYLQTPTFSQAKLGTMFPAGGRVPQRTESDFVILQVGEDWIGVREVNCVDGKPVPRPAVQKTVDGLLRESARYNIGFLQRNTNLPTFALRILRSGISKRFEFKKTGEVAIGGVRTWAVGFRETQGPTLIHDGDNHEEFATGTLWIEPDTGRVLKTEVNDAGHQGGLSFRAHAVVVYKSNLKLGMLVPVSMVEHYEASDSRKLDCQADYFNFRRFEVETHFDFGPQVPPAPVIPSVRPPSP